eukprot:XP_023977278.1 uncharacterized protein LOC102996410 [Physeter catodon]
MVESKAEPLAAWIQPCLQPISLPITGNTGVWIRPLFLMHSGGRAWTTEAKVTRSSCPTTGDPSLSLPPPPIHHPDAGGQGPPGPDILIHPRSGVRDVEAGPEAAAGRTPLREAFLFANPLASTQSRALRPGPCHLGQGPLLGPAKPWAQRHPQAAPGTQNMLGPARLLPTRQKVSLLALEDVLGMELTGRLSWPQFPHPSKEALKMANLSGDGRSKRCLPCDVAVPLPGICPPKRNCPRQTGTGVSSDWKPLQGPSASRGCKSRQPEVHVVESTRADPEHLPGHGSCPPPSKATA